MVIDAKPRKPTAAPNTKAGLLRVELAIEGVHSLLTGGFLALSQGMGRLEKLLERVADGIELQNQLLAQRTNGHAEQPSSTV